MNKFGKATLLAGASAFALGLAMSQASAFDDVDWEWDTDIQEKIKIKIDPDFDLLDPRGLVQVELLQISIGDIQATSEVKHVYNDVADVYGDPVTVYFDATGETSGHLGVYGYTKGQLGVVGSATGEIDVTGVAQDDCWWGHKGKKCDYDPVKASGYADLDVYGHTKGSLGVKGKTYGKLDVSVSGSVDLPVIVPNQLVDLAQVNSAATAVANLSTVSGNSAVFVHDGQFAIGDIGGEGGKGGWIPTMASAEPVKGYGYYYDPEDNSNLDLATIGLVAAALGLIGPADIEATSNVAHILNASVDSSATAVANLHSIDVEAELATDVMVIADLVQFSYADVTATSTVKDVTASHFEGLGGLENGLVNSTATAVGNISTINVNVGGAADDGS
jgi:hypothetical protein